jgi:hypothetical protein
VVLARFDTAHKGLNLEAFTNVALFLGGLKGYFDFYVQLSGGAKPASAAGTYPTITITFDQLVAATPYFV